MKGEKRKPYLARFRQLTVYYGYTKKSYKRITVIRLSGIYLATIGFKIGDKLSIELETNKVIITKVKP